MATRSMTAGILLLLGACASTAYDPGPPHPVDPGPGPAVVVETIQGELPPHVFDPGEHLRRTPPQPMAASLASLPPMERSGKCIAAGAVPEGRPGATVAKASKPKKKGRSPGFVPYAGNTSTAAAGASTGGDGKAAPTTAAAPAMDDDASHMAAGDAEARSFEAPMAEPAGEAELADAGGMAPPPSATDSPDDYGAADVTIAKDDRRRRKNKRARKKAERSRDRALAAQNKRDPESTPSMAEPEPASEAFVVEQQVLEPQWPPPEEGWGGATYLSNDDTMSLGSAQRVLFAIDEHLPLPPQHVRPHELLNYFSFETAAVEDGYDFSVEGQIGPSQRNPEMQTLGLAVAGRPVGRAGRRNAVLTLVVDRSGSMKAEGRMEYLKRGLLRMVRELKDGDIVHVVTFDHRVCTPLKNFVVGRDDLGALTKTIHGIRPSGSTNLHAGLTQGYTLADASYQPRYTNRVVVITDALANKGVTDARTMSMVSDWFDARRIRLSGIGVGREFNDALLDRLTEKGRGAYVFLGSEAEVDAVFGSHFSSLVETIANDVHFRLHLPPSLRMEQFHGEEASTVKADVQAVHFFADTSQLFLADLEAWQGQLRPQDQIMLEIEYQDPETGQVVVENHVMQIGEMTERGENLRKGELVMHFIDGIGRLARRGPPPGWAPRPGSWADADALADCSQTRGELREMAAGSRDPEVARILSLWDGYCARFEGSAAGRPGRKGNERWPGASR